MELNKNSGQTNRSESAARLLDTPSDLEEMIALSSDGSDEHLPAITLKIDDYSEKTSPVEPPLNDLLVTDSLWPSKPINGMNGGGGHVNLSVTPSMCTITQANSLVMDFTEEIDLSRTPPDDRPSPLRQLFRDNRLRIKPEIILAFLLAGLGNVAAGYMLAKVSRMF